MRQWRPWHLPSINKTLARPGQWGGQERVDPAVQHMGGRREVRARHRFPGEGVAYNGIWGGGGFRLIPSYTGSVGQGQGGASHTPWNKHPLADWPIIWQRQNTESCLTQPMQKEPTNMKHLMLTNLMRPTSCLNWWEVLLPQFAPKAKIFGDSDMPSSCTPCALRAYCTRKG